jgi:hypothetical protein
VDEGVAARLGLPRAHPGWSISAKGDVVGMIVGKEIDIVAGCGGLPIHAEVLECDSIHSMGSIVPPNH